MSSLVLCKSPLIDAEESERARLRARVLAALHAQGFFVHEGKIALPALMSKDAVRRLHAASVAHMRERARRSLAHHEDRFLRRWIASGYEIEPERIRPRLVEVRPRSEEELLFRYIRLHWSVPVSAGYGRRLRFLVVDEFTGKLIGIFGLCDPIFALGPRDRWIGWEKEQRRARLKHVMELFVLGAVPPYSYLLCGKLVALLATSASVQHAFRKRYEGRATRIAGVKTDARLALLTTHSALGRSSLYNRLVYGGRKCFLSVGFTCGSGEFHFSNGLYEELRRFALAYCTPTAKHARWGRGFRNRREVVRKALAALGLSPDLVYHGIRREVFVAPLGENARAFLRGETDTLIPYPQDVEDIFAYFRERWLLPRARRDARYRGFHREEYRLWK